MKKAALVTGFGPFGSVTDNPTQRLVEALALSGDRGIEPVVLPVSFERATQHVWSAVATGRFDVALLLGVAVGAETFRLETTARRTDSARIPDCDGMQPCGLAPFPDGPEELGATADVAAAAQALERAGVPHCLSHSAGGYVCNRAYYAALHAAALRSPHTACLFVHVPADPDTPAPPGKPAMTFDAQMIGVRALLDALRSP